MIWYILFMYVLILIFLHYNLHQKEITPLEQFMSMMKENLSNAYHSFRSMSISSSSVAESHNNNNHHQQSKDLENSSVSNTTISSLRASLLHSQSFRDSISSSQPSSSQHDIHQIVKTPIYSNQNSYYERKKNHPSFSQQYQQHNNNQGLSQSIKGTSFSSEPRLSERISERMVIPSDRSSLSWKMNQADLTSSPLSGLIVSPLSPALAPPSSSGQQTESNFTKKTTKVTTVQASEDAHDKNNQNNNNEENPTIEEDPENDGKDGIDEKRASYFTNPFRRSSAATGTRFSMASSMNQLRQSTIAVLNVDHLQELVHDAEFQNRLQYFFLYLLVMTINITVSISVNAGYLILQNSHNVSSQGKVIAQVILAFFKLFWNIVAIR